MLLVCFSVHLVFDGHCHQVVELVHAVGVEPHDGGVGELVEHGLQHPPAVYRLVFPEYFLYKPPVEHGGHDVVHHLRREQSNIPTQHLPEGILSTCLVCSVFFYHLSFQPSVNDVNHFPPKVDEKNW